MSHWTKKIRDENKALREALEMAIMGLRNIPQSRLNKEAAYPHGDPDHGLVYRTCAEECSRLAENVVTLVREKVAEAGVA